MKELGHYPIDSHLQDISDALRTNNTCLIKAEPGAGKTTRVPLHLLDSVEGEILVLEPRRLAARLSAERSAWFLDEKCGLKVGYRISQDKKVSRETRLTFITEGLFVRLLRDNPTLNTIGAVVLDEFHERNIHTDIALTLIRNLQHSKRPDLKLIVMSATLDSSLLENYLNSNNDKKNDNKNDNNTDNNTDTNAKKIKTDVFDIKGRSFPVEIEYITEGKSAWRIEKNWEDRVAMAVNKMVNDPRCPGNILVFLTGIGDIMIAKRRLERLFKPGEFSILPLAAGLPLKEQQRIFEETGPRKIVLSTNVAETSLTIPGITGVIDLGFAKLAAHAPWSGMPTLEVKRISQASAVQRGGRAGRTHSGVVYRLYSKPEFLNRDAFTPPDIRRIDLSHVLLDVMNLGYSPDLMQWLEPPDEKNLDSALQLLTLLGAMTGDGDITHLGKKLSVFPMHPRLSAVALHGIETGCGEDALLAACLISERFALKNDVTPPGEDEEGEPCDISMQIDLLKSALHKKPNLSGYPLRFLDNRRQKRILELYRTLARVCKLHDVPPYKTDPKKLSRCLLRGYADRVAQRRDINRKRRDIKSKRPKGASALYNFCLGRGGFMGKNSFVLNEQPKFLIAIDAVESPKQDAAKGVSIRACSSLPLDVLNDDPGKMMRSEKREEFDPKDGCLAVFQDLFYGKLKIGSKKTGVLEEGGNLAPALAQNWPYPFENDEPMTIYHSKVELLSKYGIPHNCPVFSGEMLELFFECICEGIRSLKDLKKNSLDFYIYQQLSEFDRAVLKAYTPDEIKLGNGKSLKIHYQSGKEPWGEIFLQDCYGLKKTPAIMQGKQRVILHLLGPSRRAAQVTGDLAGFWKGAYIEVHKELSRRYPKHYWPNNPAGAEPVRLKKWVT